MRVPTGAGQVRDSRNKPGSVPNELFGHLFNFDIDDATVKIEHLLWLDVFLIPFLVGCRECTVALKGMASRTGSNAYNDKLSERRVNAVRQVLLDRGVFPTQITSNFVGESQAAAQGSKDHTEEAEFRAVDVLLKRPATVLPHFERIERYDIEDGFDHETTPPFLMVPMPAGERKLLLLNAAGLLLKTTDFGVLQPVSPVTGRPVSEFVVPNNRVQITFRAVMEGTAHIELEALNGDTSDVLEIAVLRPKTVVVSFHYVEDNGGHKTARGRNSEDPMLVVVNRVFNRQANLFFVKRLSRPLKVNENWGDPVMPPVLGGPDLPRLTAFGDPAARLNLFFVWEYQRNETSDTDARVDKIGGNNILFEDDAGRDAGLSLAHEFGHNMGLHHTEDSDQLLLWPFTDDRGGRLRRDEILKAHAKA